jgi:hypothetical protein
MQLPMHLSPRCGAHSRRTGKPGGSPAMKNGNPGGSLAIAVAFWLMIIEGQILAQEKTAVALDLVLAIDCSASIDAEKFDIQLQGLATAFRDPDVQQAISNLGPRGIIVTMIEWSEPGKSELLVPPTAVSDRRSSKALAFLISLARRHFRTGQTSLRQAIVTSRAVLAKMPVSDRSVIDISGDGTDNVGGDVPKERDITIAAGVTINGLVLPDPYGADVEGYYRSHVIGGKDAFIERASGYEDFARAVRAKLLREIPSPLS